MYDFLFEDSLKILGYGLFLAVPFYVMAFHFQQRRLWIACGVITSLIIVALLIEWYVETPREELRKQVIELSSLVENNDVEGLMSHISKSNPEVLNRANLEMPRYEFRTCKLMIFHGIQLDKNQPRQASVDFMVRFNVSTSGYSGGGLRDVVLKFEKEKDGKWRIVDYAHFDPRRRPDRKNSWFD